MASYEMINQVSPTLCSDITVLAQRNHIKRAKGFAHGFSKYEIFDSMSDFSDYIAEENFCSMSVFYVNKDESIKSGSRINLKMVLSSKMDIPESTALVCFELVSGGLISETTKTLCIVDLRGRDDWFLPKGVSFKLLSPFL